MPDEQTEKRKRSRGFAVHLLARVEIFFFPMYKYCYIFFSSRKLKSKIALGDKRRKETNKKKEIQKKKMTRNLKKDTKRIFFFFFKSELRKFKKVHESITLSSQPDDRPLSVRENFCRFLQNKIRRLDR